MDINNIMATLTETAYYTRKYINWTILGIAIYFLLRIIIFILIAIWLWLFPPKPPPPNHAFGVLPKIAFPNVATPSGTLSFKLETVTGSVPAASEAAIVYFMPKSAPNLLALTRTQTFAKDLGFNPEPAQESKNVYTFKDESNPERSLKFDIVSNNFTLRYLWEFDSSIFSENNLPAENKVRNLSINSLENYNLLKDDIKNGRIQVTYLRMTNNQLVPSTSQAESDAVRVDFFRQDLNNLPTYTADPDNANIVFIYSGTSDETRQILLWQYTYWPINYEGVATYALKTSTQAWEELQNGKGFIAKYPSQGSTALVRKIHLGYYDSFTPQNFMQPIFVFEGDYGFVGYVPAVAPPWAE